jgi:hypothetical protein
VRHKRAILLLSFMSVAFASCARPKTMTPDQLRSDIRSALSLATETQLFVAQIQNARAPRAFAAGHLAYLGDEARRSARELRESQSDPAIAPRLGICAAQLDSLAREITVLQGKVNEDALLASRARVEEIHGALTRLENGL